MESFVRRGLRWLLLPVGLAILPSGLAAQGGTVSGTVRYQSANEPVPSVQVTIPQLQLSTITAANGTFSFANVPPGRYEVRFMRIGLRATNLPVEVRAGQPSLLDVRVAEAAMALDEIVVTGTAGQARRREVGNSISSTVAADVKQPVQTLETMLQGRSAGLILPTGRADMGSGQAIRLRGNASLNLTSYPLIYIDGIRQTGEGYSGVRNGGQGSMLNDIDPATIDRVEIVKGPAATALYGTEAAAGVIQIFTKRGTPGRTVWTFQTDQGRRVVRPWGSQPGTYATGLLDSARARSGSATEPCIRMMSDAEVTAGAVTPGGPSINVFSGCHRPYHDMDPYMSKPWRQRYTLSVAGGSDVVRFFTSGSGEGGRGILPNDEDLRYQFRSNVSFRPSSKVNIDVSTAYSRYGYSYTGSNNAVESLYFQVVRRPLNGPSTYRYEIIDSLLQQDNDVRTDRMILGATANWTPFTGMNHKFTVGYDDARQREDFVYPYNFLVDRSGRQGLQNTSSRTLSTDYVLSQQISLLSDFKFTLSVGGQLVQRNESNVNLIGTGLPGPGAHTVSSTSTLVTNSVTEQRVITGGFLFQNMFAFRDRYFLTVGARVDGNSAFGEDLGLQTYPKASASYVISDEAFFPDNLGTWKLRGAYGWAGRAPGAFDAIRTWTPQNFAPAGGTALVPNNPGNPALGPERSREIELGFDASVLDDRLTADFSWYHRVTKDALLNVARPPSQGNSNSQAENVGEFENAGVELGLTGTILRGENFGFELQASFATNHSKVLAVGSATVNNVQVGWPAPVVRATKVVDMYALIDPVFEPDANAEPAHADDHPCADLPVPEADHPDRARRASERRVDRAGRGPLPRPAGAVRHRQL